MKLIFLLLIFFSAVVFAKDEKKTEEKLSSGADIKLESTFVGDKEQPAVSYFIPWQGTSTPDKLQWDMEEKHDATLQLIDRDVMIRSINIYEEMDMEKSK